MFRPGVKIFVEETTVFCRRLCCFSWWDVFSLVVFCAACLVLESNIPFSVCIQSFYRLILGPRTGDPVTQPTRGKSLN
jgi:hypothetical protein